MDDEFKKKATIRSLVMVRNQLSAQVIMVKLIADASNGSYSKSFKNFFKLENFHSQQIAREEGQFCNYSRGFYILQTKS